MDDLAKRNGEIRGLFIDFLESEKFNTILSAMKKQKLSIAEINYNGHRVVINATNEVDNHDAEELEAVRRKKYIRVTVCLNGVKTTKVSGHRIKNPGWWVLTQPPKTNYLIASCWVCAQDFYDYDKRDEFKETVQEILENLDTELLHNYEAIDLPA